MWVITSPGSARAAVQVPAVPSEDLPAEPDDRHRDLVDADVDREHDGRLRVGQHHQRRPARSGAPGRHGLGDDPGLGQAVDHRLDRAAVEPQLGGQGRPGGGPVDVQPAQQRRAVVPPGLVGSGPGGGHRAVGPGGPSDPRTAHRPAAADRRRDSTSTPAASSRTMPLTRNTTEAGCPSRPRPLFDRRQHRATDDGVAEPAPTAEQRRPADHRGADREQQRVAATGGRRDRADLRRVDDRADRGERRGDHEHRRPDADDVDAGAARGLPVAADRVDVPAELRPVEQVRARSTSSTSTIGTT